MAAHDFALLVGNSDYGNELTRLDGPPNDLAAFAHWLVDPTGGALPPQNILVLADRVAALPPGVQNPAPAKWQEVYVRFFGTDTTARANRAGEGVRRRLWVLFAGHGNMPARQFGRDPITACFIPQDWKRSQPFLGWIVPVEYLRLCVDAFEEFDEIVVLMDCCRSETGELIEPARPFPITRNQVQRDREFVVLCAAQADRLAYERPIGSDGLVHGVFTASVLDGLRTLRDGRQRLSVGALLDYVRNAYGRHFADRRIKPEPDLLEAESSWPFLLVQGHAAASDVAFVADQQALGTYVQLVDGEDTFISGFQLAEPPVVRRLKTGLYRILSAGGEEIRMFRHTEAEGRTVNV